MNAKQLIEVLSQVPPETPVLYYWDGNPRSEAMMVWTEPYDGKTVCVIADELACYEEDRIERNKGTLIFKQ